MILLSFAFQTCKDRKCKDWLQIYFLITIATVNGQQARQSQNEDYLHEMVALTLLLRQRGEKGL